MVSTTQTLSQIKSQEVIGHIQNHFITSPLAYVTNGIQDFVKKLYPKLGAPDSMLFGGVQPLGPFS